MPDPTPPAVPPSLSKKVCLLGDFAVGKTSLVRRFVYDRFDDRYISSIGVKVSRKTVMVAEGAGVVELNMLLWDLAGSEEFTPVRESYLRGAAAAILVCDVTRPESAASLPRFARSLAAASAAKHLILAANKRDLLPEPDLVPGWVVETAMALGVTFHLTSARQGVEVDSLFRQLGRMLVTTPGPPKVRGNPPT